MKRAVVTFLAIIIVGVTYMPTYAAQIEPRESYVFANYWVMTNEGDNTGEIRISFSVTCSHFTSVIGVSAIEIYRANSTYVTTIEGSIENGLLRNGGNCAGEYTYQGTPGTSYYMAIVFYGVADGITETRTIVTDTVTAPY